MAYNPIITGGGTEAAAQRVTIANDSTGVVSVDDNGGSLTVDASSLPLPTGAATSAAQTDKSQFTKITDGTDTALVTASGEQNVLESNSAAIKTAVEILDNAISGSEMQVDVVTMPTITVNSHAVTNAGTFAVQVDGAALTALQLIDDSTQVLGTDTYTEAASKGITIGAVRRDADTTLVNTTNEFTPLQVDANGRLKVEAFSGETLPVSLTSTTITGTVAVTQSGTWDEVGINDSGNSITVDNAQLSVVGSGTEATAMRVTIANDSTGLLSVDDNGGSLTVDYATTGSGNATGALRVEIANNGTGVLATVGAVTAITNALPAGTNAIGKLAANSGVDIGDVDITSIAAGDNNIGNVDIVTMPGTGVEDAGETAGGTLLMAGAVRRDTPASSSGTTGDNSTVNTDANGAVWVSLATKLDATNDAVAIGSRTTGGLTTFRSLDLDESEEEIKGSAGQIYAYYFGNVATSVRYLKFYNATAANVTVGSTTPTQTFPLPASSSGHVAIPQGIAFSTAITAAVTTGVADADTGAPAANDVVLNVFYT